MSASAVAASRARQASSPSGGTRRPTLGERSMCGVVACLPVYSSGSDDNVPDLCAPLVAACPDTGTEEGLVASLAETAARVTAAADAWAHPAAFHRLVSDLDACAALSRAAAEAAGLVARADAALDHLASPVGGRHPRRPARARSRDAGRPLEARARPDRCRRPRPGADRFVRPALDDAQLPRDRRRPELTRPPRGSRPRLGRRPRVRGCGPG